MNSEIDPFKKKLFVNIILQWYDENARDFPWRKISDHYKILISEILLQKTRAEPVVDVYIKFIKKYPDPERLSSASFSDLKRDLEVLGLYSQKAEKLKNLGKALVDKYNGKIPDTREKLLELPGIGLYIANATLCFAFGYDVPLLDTNIGRIIERVFSVAAAGEERKKNKVWDMIATLVPKNKSREYNYSLIDFGAAICTSRNPKHHICPLKEICDYYLGLKSCIAF